MKMDVANMVKEALIEALEEMLDEITIQGKTLREWIEIFGEAFCDEEDGQ